ncbi:MAG: nitrophenyl compound nitroreductase subunit ArsF family protein [Lutibacter sp.]|uniref:nitrophenyl compound nitroreductase subunit ArsF family protein n=1 Tax=Lutibacter sp. TaxID=1925666 RepID=UPI00385B4A62
MKNIKFSIIIAISILLSSCSSKVKPKSQALDTSISKIEVIDFYSTHRCVTCKAIEANAKYTLDTYFLNELNENKLTFQTINVDEEQNFKIAEEYKATGTALFLNIIKNGKETHIDLTDFAFMKGMDKEAFSEELKSKLEAELKNI